MKKYAKLLFLSRSLLRSALSSEVSYSKKFALSKYSTASQEISGNPKFSDDVKIISISEKSSQPDDTLTKTLDDMEEPRALDECTEDVSYVAKYSRPSFNFAYYANKSETIQELAKLGVELYKIEQKPEAMKLILSMKFEDMKPYIQFLHDCGVPAERISVSITKNPMIFKEDIDDLRTRIRYLRAHNFTPSDIARIVTEAPMWLSWRTTEIDNKLGFFQKEFQLRGREVRELVVKRPQLITYSLAAIRDCTFAVREQMGFDDDQVKEILLNKPMIWSTNRDKLVAVFNYVHLEMGITHEILVKQPSILATRLERVKQRHLFLVSLKRAQYDPTKPLYVPLDSLAMGTDVEFCINTAKSSLEVYDMFLKTL